MLSSENSDSADSANGWRILREARQEASAEARLIRRQRTVPADWKEVEEFLRRLCVELAHSPYSVCLVSDRALRGYNQRFRRRDEPTDVLSFPAGRRRQRPSDYLGDILISAETAQTQARSLGIRLEDEIKALALHGLLHLLGYDHESDRGQMARQEKRWGARLGLPQTLLGRARSPRCIPKKPVARQR